MAPARVTPRKKNPNKKALKAINSVFIVIVTTALILFFMPRDSQFNYKYEVNYPWLYSPLIANYQFAISKDTTLVKQERDSVLRAFQPYYDFNEQAAVNAKQVLSEMVVTNDRLSPEEVEIYRKHISTMLDTIYNHYLLSSESYNELKDNDIKTVRLISGNTAKHVAVKEIYSTRKAYEVIVGSDTAHFKRPLLQLFDITRLLQDNITFNQIKSQEERDELVNQVSSTLGLVRVGEKIVDRGEVVTPAIYNKLESYRQEVSRHKQSNSNYVIILGQATFVIIIIIMLLTYLLQYRSDYLDQTRTSIMPFALMTFFIIIAELMVQYNLLNVAVVPFVMVPLMIRVFMDSRTAFLVHVSMVLIISSFLHYSYDFVIFQLLAGMVAIFSLRELSSRAQLMQTAGLVVLTYCTIYTAYTLLHENDVDKVEMRTLIYFFINGILLLFAYPLLWFLEKVFGMTSDVTLVELVNPNSKLLQELTTKAPGTYQHSLQVANLVSEVAKKIGADAQLARTGAMYHDIGKMMNPSYFTENMPAGTSKFDGMEPQQSAKIIIQHVIDGAELADRHHLPNIIKRFILTHHGEGKARYFYNTFKNAHPDEDIDEKPFTYPGPNPSTKEEAILMMSDAIEAASRSISEYTEESISKFVDKIIDGQVAEGFFLDSPITFKDISTAKRTFKERLKIIYHSRIVYPELNETAKKKIESNLDEKGKVALATAKALDEAEAKESAEVQKSVEATDNVQTKTSADTSKVEPHVTKEMDTDVNTDHDQSGKETEQHNVSFMPVEHFNRNAIDHKENAATGSTPAADNKEVSDEEVDPNGRIKW